MKTEKQVNISKPKFNHIISLTQEEEERANYLRQNGYSLTEIFRNGLNGLTRCDED